MDAKRPRLTLIYAPATRAEFNKIWKYHEKKYNKEHAAEYIDFLPDGIDALTTDPHRGMPVDNFPQLRALTLKRSPRGDGHIAIYRVDQGKQAIRVLHVYHTAQDIQGRLRRKRP